MKSVQLEESDKDDDCHNWAHTEMSLMFFSCGILHFAFFLFTIPECVVELSGVFDTKATSVELIGFLTPDARWVKIAGVEFLEVLGAFSGVFLLPVLKIVLHVGFFLEGSWFFYLVEGIKESLALFLWPHVHDHEESEGPDWFGEDTSLLFLSSNLSLRSEGFTSKSTLPPAHESDANAKEVNGIKLF